MPGRHNGRHRPPQPVFIYRAEREPLALRIEAVELGARDKEGKQLSLGLQLNALVLNPPPR